MYRYFVGLLLRVLVRAGVLEVVGMVDVCGYHCLEVLCFVLLQCILVLVCVVGNGFGMALDKFHCILGGKIVVMLFLVFVLAYVLVFYSSLYIRYETSGVCYSLK